VCCGAVSSRDSLYIKECLPKPPAPRRSGCYQLPAQPHAHAVLRAGGPALCLCLGAGSSSSSTWARALSWGKPFLHIADAFNNKEALVLGAGCWMGHGAWSSRRHSNEAHLRSEWPLTALIKWPRGTPNRNRNRKEIFAGQVVILLAAVVRSNLLHTKKPLITPLRPRPPSLICPSPRKDLFLGVEEVSTQQGRAHSRRLHPVGPRARL
jgi:hypothetical protein